MEAINVRDAVAEAKKSLRNLYQDDPPEELALEEVEFINDNERPLWSVTLGFHRRRSVAPARGMDFLARPPTPIENRVYKTLLIDANTGEFVKMDMRQIP